ncbi:MAG: cbb3-type cytochrome c oxidase subunit 3 [Gemmatimonadetes bacterium]|nr:cbb3-type cytochrome c oxidase subunit 3 [Gemmatimonadota bacterium]MBI3569179.1 cbb3-type cytochrome c oxidase subunit 3 [Gemmatimonadota bacterium]
MRSIADVVGASGLSGYAIVALILFFLAFLAVLAAVLSPARSSYYERAGRLPLDDLTPQTPREP